ncbi:hypothetical protein U1Q18_006578 [Sarracenia purpurea var. burkii]
MKHVGPISSLAINVSDDILYSGSLDKTVKVWRISDHKCIETIQAHSEPINAIVVADDGVLYTASDDATVRVWRRNFCGGDRPHSLTVTLPTKYSPVKALTLTGDGGVLYGGCTDGYIHYWLKGWFSGQLQYGGALQGHTHAVLCLACAGSYVVSGSADSTSRVWVRERDGQHSCLAVLQGHRGPVRCVAAFPGRLSEEAAEDGCTVCTGSIDGVLKSLKSQVLRRLGQVGAEASGDSLRRCFFSSNSGVARGVLLIHSVQRFSEGCKRRFVVLSFFNCRRIKESIEKEKEGFRRRRVAGARTIVRQGFFFWVTELEAPGRVHIGINLRDADSRATVLQYGEKKLQEILDPVLKAAETAGEEDDSGVFGAGCEGRRD